jgi:glutamate synthase (NADPH/NADH) small chain
VFLGLGLHAFRSLGIPGEDRDGVYDSARFIERIRQAPRVADLPVGRTVVVIGGGSTAIDIAIEMKQLGAESVTIVYRSAEEKMSATSHERELARNQGVVIRSHARPTQIFGKPNGSHSVEFERTDRCTGERFELHAEQVFKAIGQTLDMGQWWGQGQLHLTASGKIAVNEKFETSVPGVFAAGDCVASGDDLTVSAVQQGKLVAQAIHAQLNPMEKGEVNDGRSHLSDRGSEISQSFLAGFSTPNG